MYVVNSEAKEIINQYEYDDESHFIVGACYISYKRKTMRLSRNGHA